MTNHPTRVQVIDSHTGGEPTRVVILGGPNLGNGSLAERRSIFREQFDEFRSAIIQEPRGSDILVGALLCEPVDPECIAGVIFFNNVGVIGMCGHGTMGVVITLAHLGRITLGKYHLETPVGVVQVEYRDNNTVMIENVPSYRLAKDVAVEVDGETVLGDIAWGGNWFYLIEYQQQLDKENIDQLTAYTKRVRQALEQNHITGIDGAVIDHIELFGPSTNDNVHSKNFVLCPGMAYDRSPCGTGTSAKLACMVADGKIQEGQIYRQESIIGSIFEGSVRLDGDQIIPQITGSAYITAESTLLFDPNDPWRFGIR